jgi:hypothetical protein
VREIGAEERRLPPPVGHLTVVDGAHREHVEERMRAALLNASRSVKVTLPSLSW